MPDNQLHKSQPDAISFCFVVLCQSWEELDKKNIRFGHWCWTRYPCITWRTKTVRSRCWQIWEGFMSSGMCHWMCDMIPNFRRNVAPSLSGVSSPSTYPTKGHNIPVDLNFHQHRCENLKSQTSITVYKIPKSFKDIRYCTCIYLCNMFLMNWYVLVPYCPLWDTQCLLRPGSWLEETKDAP